VSFLDKVVYDLHLSILAIMARNYCIDIH
jgi:hypothetical protein